MGLAEPHLGLVVSIHTDADLKSTFHHMVQADSFIMADSSLSIAAAMLRNTTSFAMSRPSGSQLLRNRIIPCCRDVVREARTGEPSCTTHAMREQILARHVWFRLGCEAHPTKRLHTDGRS